MLYRRFSRSVLIGLVILAAVSSTSALEQGQLKTASQEELDVIKVLLKQEAAWDRGDIDGFLEGYKDSPDTLFINNLIQRGFAGMKADYHRNYPTRETMGQLTFSELEVHPIDDKVAVCIGKYKIERSKKNGGNAESLFSMVFEKTEAGWKIVVAHTT
jgi:ketosteroid isomerase-like protein